MSEDISAHSATHVPAPEDDSRRETLSNLSAQATGAYGRKDYTKAAELYSDAVELQAELNGEMLPENAELLYAYGRCLYKIGVSRSDVLGNKVAGDSSNGKKRKRESKMGPSTKQEKDMPLQNRPPQAEKKDRETSLNPENKPYFELQGDDADWDDSEEDEEAQNDAQHEAEDGDDDDDDDDDEFAAAYEILDLARVLLERKIEALREKGKGKEIDKNPSLTQSLEKLADIHDLQAEISLENENFPLAVADSRAALAILEDIFPLHSRLVAESHFKLSLALEFASVTQIKSEVGSNQDVAQVDEKMRAEAADHTAKTIESCRARRELEEAALQSLVGDEAEEKKKQIKDVSEMLEEFEQRLQDLRTPTAPMIADPASIFAGAFSDTGTASGREQKAASAQDISSLVKHKKKTPAERRDQKQETVSGTNGKRAAEDVAPDSDSKRTKVDESGE